MTDTTATEQRAAESRETTGGPAIRPFRIDIPDEDLAELRPDAKESR